MPTSTRRASPGDIPILVEMMREFYAEAAYALEEAWAGASFSALLKDDSRGVVWIVSEGREPAGYAVLTFRHSMEFGGLDAFIDDLFIRPRFRRRGLGKAVVGSLFEGCGRRGVLAVHVETANDNAPALGFYGAFGLRDRQRLLLTARLTERTESTLGSG